MAVPAEASVPWSWRQNVTTLPLSSCGLCTA